MLIKKIFSVILLICSLSLPISHTHATSIMDTGGEVSNSDNVDSVMDWIELIASQLSCQIAGISSILVRGEMSNTCISSVSMFDGALYTLLSPNWPFAAMTLKMNYDKLPYLKTSDGLSQCHVNNRADFSNPTVNFAFCSNSLLRVGQLLNVYHIIADLISGENIQNALLDNLLVDPVVFHAGTNPVAKGHIEGSIGQDGFFIDPLAMPPMPIYWKVVKNQDTIAVATTMFGIFVPIGSKLIKEPYPISKYDQIQSTGCQSITECFKDLDGKSKTFMNFSGKLVECTRQMLVRSLIDANLCNNLTGQSVGTTDNNLFHTFQINMTNTVRALLTLYIMFFGINILLTGGEIKKSDLIMFVIKFVLVVYFSIGMNVNGQHYDGIMTYLIPMMLYGGSELANMVMNISSDTYSGLCYYTSSDYPAGYGYMAMWDALDCRIWNYLGLQGFFNFFNADLGWNFVDAMYTPIPFYILLLMPCIYFGWVQLALILITYPFFVIGLAIYAVQSYMICMICIILLAVLAPIFVPFSLFEYTKGYFQSWYKLMLSFGLQSLVVAVFMTLVFNIFDSTFNHTCQFYSQNSGNKKIFLMKTNASEYASEDEFLECTKSLGFMFTPGGIIAQASGGTVMDQSVVTKGGMTSLDKYKESFPFLSIITNVKGMFTNHHGFSTKGVVDGIKGSITTPGKFLAHIMFEMICCIIMLYIMKNMSDQLSDFAADMTEGISVGAVTMSPNKLNDLKDKVNSLYKKAKSGELQKDMKDKAAELGLDSGHGGAAGGESGHGGAAGGDSGHGGAAGGDSGHGGGVGGIKKGNRK
jgi:type IV secretion system protein VirB6